MRILGILFLCAALFGGEEIPLPVGDRLQAQALTYVQSQVTGRDGTYTFKIFGHSLIPSPPKGEVEFEPAHLSRTELSGPFYASFNVLLGGRTIGMVRVDMEGRWVGKLLRFRTALPRKTVPLEGQLESFDFEGARPAGALSEIPEGFRLRTPVLQGHILSRTDLEAIPLILAGETVRLELAEGDLSITLDALARSSGAAGDKVRLEMPTSHKMIQAVVMGPGAARVQWSGAK